MKPIRLQFVTLFLVVAVTLAARAEGAAITGVVSDSHGTPQMGALVQVISLQGAASNALMAHAVYTDMHGRYTIPNVIPGKYQLKATAALFLPALRENLQLRPGAQAVVNLTLSTLFEAVQWLPAQKRKADEPADDWKWTLRSAANRPILRMLEDGPLVTVSTSNERQKPSLQARVAVESGDGGFAHGGIHNVFTVDRVLGDGTGVILRADLGSPESGYQAGPSADLSAGYERKINPMTTVRSVMSYQEHPELIGGVGALGFQTVTMQNAEQTLLGDMLAIEAGSEMTAIRMGGGAIDVRPFAKVTLHPADDVLVAYRVATARDLQGWEDMDAVQPDLPVAVMSAGQSNRRQGLRVEKGVHQEISLSRKTGGGLIEAAYYRDDLMDPVISGGGTLSGAEIAAGNVLADPSTGNFRMLGPGFRASGLRFSAIEPLTPTLWAVLEYTTGSALGLPQFEASPASAFVTRNALQPDSSIMVQARPNGGLQAAANSLVAQNAESVTVALRGKVLHTGTYLRAAYRWQPQSTVTAVDSYHAFSDQPYFSFFVRQPLYFRHFVPHGVEALVDVTNLLAQGYHPFLSSDGHTLFFAQSPRVLQGGLSFVF